MPSLFNIFRNFRFPNAEFNIFTSNVPFVPRAREYNMLIYLSVVDYLSSCIVNLSKINSLINIDIRYNGTKKEVRKIAWGQIGKFIWD